MIKQKAILLGIISVLSLFLGTVLFIWNPLTEPFKHSNVPLASGLNPRGGGFTVEVLNADLSLSDFLGKTVILYFGYSQCPDVCPITLSTIADALNQMNTDELASVQTLFVSFDPDRDNTVRTAEYAQNFHTTIIGATAEPDVLEEISQRYGVVYNFVESDVPAGFVINHSSTIYIVGKNGELVKELPYGTTASAILESIREQ